MFNVQNFFHIVLHCKKGKKHGIRKRIGNLLDFTAKSSFWTFRCTLCFSCKYIIWNILRKHCIDKKICRVFCTLNRKYNHALNSKYLNEWLWNSPNSVLIWYYYVFLQCKDYTRQMSILLTTLHQIIWMEIYQLYNHKAYTACKTWSLL